MSRTAIRLTAAVAAFLIVSVGALVLLGRFDVAAGPEDWFNAVAANSFALVFTLGLIAGGVAYLLGEYAQTGRLDSVARQFDTRTVVLMPVAIALNIVLGAAVANVLKVPIYLDSIGTILVGALGGPIAGAVTGALTNLLWTYLVPPPLQNGPAAAFAVVAVVIGILAGLFGRRGWLRPRPGAPRGVVSGAAITVLVLTTIGGVIAFIGFRALSGGDAAAPEDAQLVSIFGIVLAVMIAFINVVTLGLLYLRRDMAAVYVVAAGVITGVVAALISAPISAGVFGGVTGGGTDFLVAAFRQAGLDPQTATLAQGAISDPIDKIVTFFVVYLILTSMAERTKARFPQGELLVSRDAQERAAA